MIESDQKVIFKNTIFLYLRMFIVLAVSLYTSRIVLDKLGVEDYGIYNIVGSVVVAFAFVDYSLNNANQRFYSFTLGKGDNCSRVFSMSINIQLIMLVVLIVLLETIGLYFFNNVIKIPEARKNAASIVYQLSILTFCINFLRSPYNSLIIAYEKMSIYAVFSIVDVILKLGICFLLIFSNTDKLILYAFLMMLVTFIGNLMYMGYCKYNINEVNYQLLWDKRLWKEMFAFSSWNLIGGVSAIAKTEGPNYLINNFFGVLLNASMGLSKQVSLVIYNFAVNFQTAFNPQIVKLYAAGNYDSLNKLIFRASKLSFYLMFVVALPVMCSQDIFELWLKEVPQYTRLFCVCFITAELINTIQSPLWMTATAIGNIRNYQLWMCLFNLLTLLLAWICLTVGFHPSSVIIMVALTNVMAMVYRLWYLKSRMEFDIWYFYKEIVFKELIALPIITVPVIYFVGTKVSGLLGLIEIGIASVMIVTTIFYYVCLNKDEKLYVKDFVKSKIRYKNSKVDYDVEKEIV